MKELKKPGTEGNTGTRKFLEFPKFLQFLELKFLQFPKFLEFLEL